MQHRAQSFGFPHPVNCCNKTDLHRICIKPANAFSLIIFLKNSSSCSPRVYASLFSLLPLHTSTILQIWGWCDQSDLLITSSVRWREEGSHPPTDHVGNFCSLLSPQLCLGFPREGGSSAVLIALKLVPKRREILREFPSSSKGIVRDREAEEQDKQDKLEQGQDRPKSFTMEQGATLWRKNK